MKIYINLLHEIPFLHEMMDKFDLTDTGSKVYVKSRTIQLETDNEDETNFKKIIEEICFKQHEELQSIDGIGKPVFVYALSDKLHRLVYFREGINQISDGEKIVMFDDYIRHFLSPKVDERRRVVAVGYEQDGEFKQIKCYSYDRTTNTRL